MIRQYDQAMSEPSASASVQIDASPAAVYSLIADLPTLAELAEEAVAMELRNGEALTEGAVFVGHNENSGKRWTTKCTVTHAQPGRVFAFDVQHTFLPIARWQYDIVEADGGCRVTESTWDRRPGWFRKVAGLATGVSDRTAENKKNIELTLQRLKQRAETR